MGERATGRTSVWDDLSIGAIIGLLVLLCGVIALLVFAGISAVRAGKRTNS
jgi:hypothetical protein